MNSQCLHTSCISITGRLTGDLYCRADSIEKQKGLLSALHRFESLPSQGRLWESYNLKQPFPPPGYTLSLFPISLSANFSRGFPKHNVSGATGHCHKACIRSNTEEGVLHREVRIREVETYLGWCLFKTCDMPVNIASEARRQGVFIGVCWQLT